MTSPTDDITSIAPGSGARPRTPLYRSMFFQLIIAIALGITIGMLFPDLGTQLKPLGDGFIRLIKMIIAPLIFLVIVTGIAHMGDVRSVGRVGVKALSYFLVASTFALIFGLVVGNLVAPGAGLNIDPSTLSEAAVEGKTGGAKAPDAATFILGIIPASIVDAFAQNALLQVLVCAVFVGSAVVVVGRERVAPVMNFFDSFLTIIYTIMGWIMKLAPIGAFGAMAFVIGQYGVATLGTYAKLIVACYAAALLFIALLALVLWAVAGVSLWKFLRYTRAEFGLALGTASTESVLPRMITKLTEAGCSRAVTGLVMPTGYSFNLDGAAIYLSISLLFLAQAFGVHLDLGQQIAALGVLLLTSKGMAGVPGSSFLALSATAAALGIFPIAGVALLLGADRIMDSMRVTVNLLGNCVATFVIAVWEGQLDRALLNRALSGAETDTAETVPAG